MEKFSFGRDEYRIPILGLHPGDNTGIANRPLPDWDIDIGTGCAEFPREGPSERQPLKVYLWGHTKNGECYEHRTYPKNDGLYIPNIIAGLQERFDSLSDKCDFEFMWDHRNGRVGAVNLGMPTLDNDTVKSEFLLQYAARMRKSLKFVEAVFRACPEAIAICHPRGQPSYLPLHLACDTDRIEHEVVTFLLKHYPQAARNCHNKLRRLPIHILMTNRPHLETVKRLVEAFPESLQTGDSLGHLPLHIAIRARSNPAIVEYLVEQTPQALCHPDSPLRQAITTYSYYDIFEGFHTTRSWSASITHMFLVLIRPYPQALVDPDKEEVRSFLVDCYNNSNNDAQKIPEMILEYANQVQRANSLQERLDWLTTNGQNIGNFGSQRGQHGGDHQDKDHFHACLRPLQDWIGLQKESLEEELQTVSSTMEATSLRVQELDLMEWERARDEHNDYYGEDDFFDYDEGLYHYGDEDFEDHIYGD